MSPSATARLHAAAILGGTIVLPLLGAWGAGQNLRPIFTFPPPLAIPTAYPHWSWIAITIVVSPFVALAGAWVWQHGKTCAHGVPSETPPQRPNMFPSWGWAAIAWTLLWWALAWTRFGWFAAFQQYTFFPLWLGFILTGRALLCRLGRRQAAGRTSWPSLALFLTSGAFWWLFEWLNRFVRNWHYLGVEDFGALAYGFHATLCFSTVLPAVSITAELLGTHNRWCTWTAAGPALGFLRHRNNGTTLVIAGVVALVGVGLFPRLLYPALWAAPLALLLGDAVLSQRSKIVAELVVGDWRRAASWAVAALICGFFWELWNFHSLAKWIYNVPYVDRWHVFEMPILGYLGYLPFGLECYFVVARVFGADAAWPFSNASST